MKNIHLANTKLNNEEKAVTGEIVTLGNEKYYKISNYDLMPDFLVAVVSDSDLWMYISSNGSLTAGRKDRDNALFPYYTEDKIHDYRDKTGTKTACLVQKEGVTFMWEPFAPDHDRIYRLERNLYKSIHGNKIIFEETNRDLEITFRYGWYSSQKYGWIKKSQLENSGMSGLKIEILDGIRNILPYGVDYAFQNEYSNLLIAYRKNELLTESNLGLFKLSSIPVDTAEPSEALKTTVVWAAGTARGAKYLISDRQLETFRRGENTVTETDIFAARGSYYTVCDYDLDKERLISWYCVTDGGKDITDVINLDLFLKTSTDIIRELEDDIAACTLNLVKIVASADGLQLGGDELFNARHFTNLLYNVMRGGIFENNYSVRSDDFRLYVSQCNTRISKQFSKCLEALPERIGRDDLIMKLREEREPDLERICYEYLPLTFSRRHGDPSRPWNRFSIESISEDGRRKLSYQGNWRDIFQNWEALCISYPGYIESVIARFVNASTADGYNPYRITREGPDWERPHHDDPWAYIGYWGDHQVIYLQKFLEQSYDFNPGKLYELLDKEIFVFTNIPYRIKSIEKLIQNPKDTIVFDRKLNSAIDALTERLGSDGKLLRGQNGEIYRVNLLEKILCSLFAKLVNFIPGAGIWLNTQRPEWNDANNALVGNGASIVTLCYLRRSLRFWINLLEKSTVKEYLISDEVNTLFNTLSEIFKTNIHLLTTGFSDSDRYNFAVKLGRAGSNYRKSIYTNSFSGRKSVIMTDSILDLMKLSIAYTDHSIEENRRNDGLFHSYNLIVFKNKEITVRRLYLMLEGQVAVLSSGLLTGSNSLRLLDSLRASELYRPDQQSYMLYPFRQLPRFTEKNNILREKVSGSKLLRKLISLNDVSIISEDAKGGFHFNSEFRNAAKLSSALDRLDKNLYGRMVKEEREYILDQYESVFDHQSFTGRSGTFYGYEGLGSIYWHMVSKLLLAALETYQAAAKSESDKDIPARILDHYYEIKEGLGIHKSPAVHGAFPIDAYSHTPAGEGAKQPGLTGQVKEDIISRFGELGLLVKNGTISFAPSMLKQDELLSEEENFIYFNPEGNKCNIKLRPGQLAFTFCQVPVIYSAGAEQTITLDYSNGEKRVIHGSLIDAETSRNIFERQSEIRQIEFTTDKFRNKNI